MKKKFFFFATNEDVECCLNESGTTQKHRYYEVASLSTDSMDFDDFKIILHNDKSKYFLMSYVGINIQARELTSGDGSRYYGFDQLVNPDSIMVDLGTQDGKVLTYGTIATLGQTKESMSIFNQILKGFKKKCQAIQSYLVAPEALKLFRSGYRLTSNKSAPKIYDLREKSTL